VSPRPKPDEANTPHVLVVSDCRETLDGLQAYLQRAGVSARGTRLLDGPAWQRSTINAVVLFPDDFGVVEVECAVARLAAARPTLLQVLVTREPRRFGSLAETTGAVTPPVILAKPAWGWTILDAIRAQSVASA
jgi:hypothetical protein